MPVIEIELSGMTKGIAEVCKVAKLEIITEDAENTTMRGKTGFLGWMLPNWFGSPALIRKVFTEASKYGFSVMNVSQEHNRPNNPTTINVFGRELRLIHELPDIWQWIDSSDASLIILYDRGILKMQVWKIESNFAFIKPDEEVMEYLKMFIDAGADLFK